MQSQDISLVGLPRELLDNIARYLPTKDFNALRSTSKVMEDKVFPYWANCFFRKRQFMIDPFSLKTLVDISEHKSLSKVMVHLVIGLDDFMGVDAQMIQNGETFNQWRSAAYAQQTLLLSGIAANLLSTALHNLPNLKTVDLRDFDSPTRYRDAVGQQPCYWRSYGHSNYGQWKHAISGSSRRIPFCNYVFQAVLAALDQCSPELGSLEVILKKKHQGLSEDSFALFPVLGAGLKRTLHGLTKLHLDVAGQMFDNVASHGGSFTTPQGATTYLRGFLSRTTNVTWLRLNFETFTGRSEAVNSFFGWLGLDPDSAPPAGDSKWNEFNPAPVALPLRRLDIGITTIRADVLCKALAKFSDLESICIKETLLDMTDDHSPTQGDFDNEDADEGGDSIWASLIRGLSKTNPRLKHLSLSNLRQRCKQNRPDSVVFYDGDSKAYQSTLSITNVDHAKLNQLARKAWTWRGLDHMQSRGENRQALDNEDEDLDEFEDEDEEEEEDSSDDED
ncbi:hypothetical protein VPNG_05861 [Cytospora leucostoma]|uniref:F-box domain-containing protein n=1 Tax=Cytospora leucostoma TaxID=1230097 RepID=A0A423X0N4_9PEZI|nr:hypothetical protein VPNG_05861 [Cytospora leucostoma]